MSEPKWLALEWVLAIHDEQLARFGGGTGIRDQGLLESALARPQNLYAYEPDVTMPALAAAYGSGIVRNHPFVDGNKRTGLLSISAFLFLNGYDFHPEQVDEVRIILLLASGDLSDEEFTEWVAKNSFSGRRRRYEIE